MTIYPRGVIVFAIFCALLAFALSNPTWMHIAEAVATVLIALSVAGIFAPSLIRKSRGL